ncbi:aminoacyl-tRNA hydrolase [Thermosulfuriphilus sp.]
MWLVVGLGNPGPTYQFTRHNIGFLVLEALVQKHSLPAWKSWCFSLVVKTKGFVLARPQTYMNLSGRAVACLVKELGLSPSGLLVVHDDLDLPLGRIKLVRSGGAGGHRGVLSIIDVLGTKDFPRLKLGIGRPESGISVADYVLSPFREEEWGTVSEMIERALLAIEAVVQVGLEKAMNIFNAPVKN